MELNKYSKRVTQDDSQPAAKAMLHAIGLTKEDLIKVWNKTEPIKKGDDTKEEDQ